jgi:O-antigen ligase
LGGHVLTGTYLAGLAAASALVAIYFWRSADPFIPFLVLVAAIQGGVLLKFGSSGSVQTIMPFLGGCVVLALLVKRPQKSLPSRLMGTSGERMYFTALALLLVVVTTAAIQYFRPGGTSLDRTGLLTLIQLVALVVITVYLVRTPGRFLAVAIVTVAAGVFGSVLTLADRLGLVTLGTEMTTSGYQRVSGANDDPNKAAFQLLIPLAFAINLALGAKTVRGKVMWWTASAILAAGIVSTYSAGALLGLAAVAMTAVVLQFRVSLRNGVLALAFLGVLTVAVTATLPADYTQVVANKYSSTATGSFADIGTNRGAAWEAGLRAVAANPLAGSGLSTATVQQAVAAHFTQATITDKAAHNMYIAMAVGTGLVGLAAFLALIGFGLLGLWTVHSRALEHGSKQVSVAAACLITAVVVALTQGLELDLQMEKYLWLLVGALLAVRYWRLGSSQSPTAAEAHE